MSIKDRRSDGTAGAAIAGATRGQLGNRKLLLFAVLLVLATFPQATQEFIFKFGEGKSDEDSVADTAGVGIKRASLRRNVAEKKFKFHKIERVYDADDDKGNDEDTADENEDEAESDKREYKRKFVDKKRAPSAEEEDDEVRFERVRKAEKAQKAKLAKEGLKTARSKEDSNGFFSSMFGGLFGGKEEESKKQKESSAEKIEEVQRNGIIDWLMWLGEKTANVKSTPPPKTSEEESWIAYLDRWPFNSLFPFGKSTKPVSVPRRSSGDTSQASKKRMNDDDRSNRDENSEEQPMSEARFEYLLHTLPGFVINSAQSSTHPECLKHIQVFHRQLRGKKLWTLQMLDATGKITSGILRGNINQLGDFDLCTQAKAVVKVSSENQIRIRGKYCLAHIEAETDVPELRAAVHLTHGRGLLNSHLGNPSHFLSRYSVAKWGVCIPHVCPAAIVREMLNSNLRAYNETGIEFHVDVNEEDCQMRPSKRLTKKMPKDQNFSLAILYLTVHVLLVLAAFLYEHGSKIRSFIKNILKRGDSNSESNVEIPSEQQEETAAETEVEAGVETETATATEEEKVTNDLIDAATSSLKHLLLEAFQNYSPKQTLSKLISTESLDMEFPIFHILKLVAILMLYICLKYMMLGHLPISDRDKLVHFVERPLSILFRAPFIYADVLLLLSGFMAAYQLSAEMAEKRHIHLLKRLSAKVLRYLPIVFFVIVFQTWILPHLSSGPLWNMIIGQHAQICEQQMWRNAFTVQNAIDIEDTCSPMTIQLALEVQLYLLGPLIVWLYHTDGDACFFVYGALHAISVAARYSRTNREHLSMTLFHGINVSKFYRSANLLFSSPISRATPYLLGLGAGLVYRSENGSFEPMAELIPLGWMLCVLSLLWCFWSPSGGMSSDFIYNSSDAASYAAWSPLLLSLALCWIIFMLSKSENSILRFLGSCRPVLFLSRIALPLQLVTYIVVLYNTANARDVAKFHVTNLFNFNEIGAILFYGIILAFVVDVPLQQIRHILVSRLFAERSHTEGEEPESEPISSSEQANVVENEGVDISPEQQSTSETPEPADSVWGSDPEEEEQKYLTRRRSSTIPNEIKDDASEEKEKNEVEEGGEEAEEEEEESDIKEEDEVKKRPPTPPVTQVAPRRRRPVKDDD